MLSLRCLDVDVALAVSDPALAAIMSRLCRGLSPGAASNGRSVRVTVRGEGPYEVDSPAHHAMADDIPAAVTHTLTALNLSTVGATRLYAMHAAVLTRDGITLVVPATSGTGKTTLTVALLQQGWRYASDEALGLPWDGGDLVAYPRAISLSQWSAERLGVSGEPGFGETHLAPLWPIDHRPGPVTHVLLLHRDGSRPRIDAIHRADVVVELLRRSFTHFQDPPAALRALANLVRKAEVGELHLGDPSAAAAAVTVWATR